MGACLVCAAAILTGVSRLWAAPEPVGRVHVLTGKVTTQRTGEMSSLADGDLVFVKDRILTGQGSSAEIVFTDDSRMKLGENTDLEVVDFVYHPDERARQGLISLKFGKIRFVMRDIQQFGDRGFSVQTGSALIAGGTDFIVSHERESPRDNVCPDGLVSTLCLGNSVVVVSLEFPGESAVLARNMISRVCGPNMPATPPRFAAAAELAGMLDLP